jgi:hypothetical protein
VQYGNVVSRKFQEEKSIHEAALEGSLFVPLPYKKYLPQTASEPSHLGISAKSG